MNTTTALIPTTPSADVVVDAWDDTLEAFLSAKISSPNTRRAYARHLNRFANFSRSKGAHSVTDITPAHLAAYRAEVVSCGDVGPASKNQTLAAVRSLVLWARGLGANHLPDRDTLREVFALPKAKVERPFTILSDAESSRLLTAATASSPRDRAMVALMLGAGLRVSEVVALTPRHLVETVEGSLLLHVEGGKGGKDRTVPLGEDLAAILRGYFEATLRYVDHHDEAPLFAAADRAAGSRETAGLTTGAVDQVLRRLVEKAEITGKRISCHSLRHTFAVRFLSAGGGDVRMLSKILGHSSLSTTMKYVDHLETDDVAEAMPSLPKA